MGRQLPSCPALGLICNSPLPSACSQPCTLWGQCSVRKDAGRTLGLCPTWAGTTRANVQAHYCLIILIILTLIMKTVQSASVLSVHWSIQSLLPVSPCVFPPTVPPFFKEPFTSSSFRWLTIGYVYVKSKRSLWLKKKLFVANAICHSNMDKDSSYTAHGSERHFMTSTVSLGKEQKNR